VKRGNLFAQAEAPPTGERFETLLQHKNLVIERIISSSHITPTAYVQAQDEWVVLLHGEAVLEVDGRQHALKSGDYLFLAAGLRHTVLSASDGALWLAVHLHPMRGDA
jgi:cupin 2 domain-containing protein